MKINFKVVSGILLAALVYDEVAGEINRRRHEKLKLRLKTERDLTDYLAHKLDDAEIPFTTFDKIVMHNL